MTYCDRCDVALELHPNPDQPSEQDCAEAVALLDEAERWLAGDSA